MIKLTPIEIERHNFKTVWRGYDPDEVRAFLGQISHQLTTLIREQEKSEEVLEIKAQRLAQVEDYEIRLRDALLAASTLAEQTREEARRESELTIREAEVRADQILKEGRQAFQNLMSETHALKRQRERLSVELRSVVESHLRMLENQEGHLRNAQDKWQAEEDQWRTTANTMFNPESTDQLATNTGDNALIEARELTLALGTSLGETLSTPSNRDDEAGDGDLLTPSIPEPLTNRPLASSRLSTGKVKAVKLSSAAALPQTKENIGDPSETGDINAEKSGVARLQQVLSEVPRSVDPVDAKDR